MADVSHELRTPLAVLRGELEAMQDGVRQMTQDSLASLQAEVSTLTKLVNDLHQLSMSDAGALAYRKEHIDVIHLVQIAASAFHDRFAMKNIVLSLDLPEKPVCLAIPIAYYSCSIIYSKIACGILMAMGNLRYKVKSAIPICSFIGKTAPPA